MNAPSSEHLDEDRVPPSSDRPLVVHVLDRFARGGMETVALNLIEHSRAHYRHHVLCLRDGGEMAAPAEALGVSVETIGKQPGKHWGAYPRLRRRLRALSPDIVHSYNIGALDVAFWARLAGVRRVVHAEHGRDASDPFGRKGKHRVLRRLMGPMISRFVAVSDDLAHWLKHDVRIPTHKVLTIHNGIDTTRYSPAPPSGCGPWPAEFAPTASTLIGTVGRLDPVKAFDTLIEAFALLRDDAPTRPLRLVIVGDGPERENLTRKIEALGLHDRILLAGARNDVPAILRALDIYVCSSIAEGMALTILEAMASGLPVVATRVGGNPELVVPDETGALVPVGKPDALAAALTTFVENPDAARAAGHRGRERACKEFSLQAMTTKYCQLYDSLLGRSLSCK